MSTPKRIQRERTKGWKMPENTVSVCRPGKWGNPFIIGQVVSGKELGNDFPRIELDNNHKLVLAYKFWIDNTKDGRKIKETSVELRGKNLACFCPLDKPCHADVLLEIANS